MGRGTTVLDIAPIGDFRWDRPVKKPPFGPAAPTVAGATAFELFTRQPLWIPALRSTRPRPRSQAMALVGATPDGARANRARAGRRGSAPASTRQSSGFPRVTAMARGCSNSAPLVVPSDP